MQHCFHSYATHWISASQRYALTLIFFFLKPLAEHLPWPKYVAEDDLLLFANRLKILRIFAKLNGYLDFPASDWWTKLEIPSFLLKQTSKLIYLCKECEIGCALDKLIMAKLNSPVWSTADCWCCLNSVLNVTCFKIFNI